jgi:hypothetical protein
VTNYSAETALNRLSKCRQAVARFLLYDETFPKMKERVYSLGVNVVDLSNRFIIDIIFSAGHFVFTRILSSRSYRFNCFDHTCLLDL